MASRFTYSSLITPKKTKFFVGTQLALRKNKFRGYWLDKSVHLYRMWFHFARLVIDCERNDIRFGAKNQHSTKLNRRFYRLWQLDQYLDAQFDDWFQDKIHLFGEEEVTLVKSAEQSADHLLLRFNKRQRKEDVLRQARLLLKDGEHTASARYQIKKQHKYFYLHQQYNAFILRQNGAKNAEVRDWLNKHYGGYGGRVSSDDTSLRRVYRAGEQVVLDVAEGDF